MLSYTFNGVTVLNIAPDLFTSSVFRFVGPIVDRDFNVCCCCCCCCGLLLVAAAAVVVVGIFTISENKKCAHERVLVRVCACGAYIVRTRARAGR